MSEKLKTASGLVILVIVLSSCTDTSENPEPAGTRPEWVSAVDISGFPEIEQEGPVFYDRQGQEASFLEILRNNGVNTIRLRLWIGPQQGHCGFAEVSAFAHRLRNMGFAIWLSLHYSSTWADPAHQIPPARWQGTGFEDLQDSVKAYTQKVVREIRPSLIQIGNEINPGFLHPTGNRHSHPQQFLALLNAAVQGVRDQGLGTEIIIHYAGLAGSRAFFNDLQGLDYDIIGLSYYPIWHGKNLAQLSGVVQSLGERYDKAVIIAETAYPFTLGWNDYTNNIVVLEEQLILPQFPATPKGQQDFIAQIKAVMADSTAHGLGFCYWGAARIAWKGPQATDASAWENQALFGFDNQALPVLQEFLEK